MKDNSRRALERALLYLSIGETEKALKISGWQIGVEYLLGGKLPDFSNLAPPIIGHLRKSGAISELSPEIAKNADTLFKYWMVYDDYQNRRLKDLLADLANSGIEVILLKKAALNYLVYSEFPRLAVDIDLLVKPHNYERVGEKLAALGGGKIFKDEDGLRQHTTATVHEIGYSIPGPFETHIDLHKGFAKETAFYIDYEGVWARSVECPAHNDSRIRMLSPEDFINHLSIHSFWHRLYKPHFILDAYKLCEALKPDWEKTRQIALKWSALTPLYILLMKLEYWLDMQTPQKFLKSLVSNPAKRKLIELFYIKEDNILPPRDKYFRLNQLEGMLLLDSPQQSVKFAAFYSKLRALDALYTIFPRGKN